MRDGNNTSAVISIALDGARAVGADVALLDLGDYDLPFCDGRDDESSYPLGDSGFAPMSPPPTASSSAPPSITAPSPAFSKTPSI